MSENKVYEDLKPAQRLRKEQLLKEYAAGNYTFDDPYLVVEMCIRDRSMWLPD